VSESRLKHYAYRDSPPDWHYRAAFPVSDHEKPQLEGLGDQLIHQGHDHGIHHLGQS
jgi:hypothetical protein